jgi:uncharacterized repeat protein (TIGR01451 family)/fimbrial isopeptide formation D2 family protein
MHTLYDLIRFYVNGSAIKYTIGEFYVTKYRTVVTNSTAYNWTIINTELVNITVTKVWTDNDNQDGVRPKNITVTLYDDGVEVNNVTLDESNNWTHMFKNLDMFNADGTLINYTVTENDVANYTVNITRNNVSFVINNTHVIELINVTVVKVWNDNNDSSGKRPASVTVILLADGSAIANTTLSVSNAWTFTFEKLDKYKHNGTLIKYSIDEVDVGVPGYTTNITNSTPYYWIVNNTYVPDVDKIANESTVFYHGYVEYNITVTNNGTGIYNKTLTLIDTLPYGLEYIETLNITGARVVNDTDYDDDTKTVTWVITDIDPKVPAVITIKVRTYDIDNLTNPVTLIGPNGYNKTVNCTIKVLPIVDVSVNKTADSDVYYENDIVVWTVVVSNAANGTNATDVELADLLPREVEFINYTATVGNYSNGIWTIGFMGNGTSETLVIYSRAVIVAEDVLNIAVVTCNETEWDYTNNVDNATITIKELPHILKKVNNTLPFYHEYVEFNLSVINDGDYDYTKNITVVDNLPEGIVYIETLNITGAVVVKEAVLTNNNRTVTWVITNVSANTTATITFKARAVSVGFILNPDITYYENGLNMTVNCTLEVLPIVDVSVIKTADKEVYTEGDVIVWTVVVSNAANGTNATDVKLADLLPKEVVLINYTATVGNYTNGIWTIGFMGNGTSETLVINSLAAHDSPRVVNTAVVSCNETEWNYTNNIDNATVIIQLPPPPYKVVNNTKPFYHENVTYNLTVINDGDYSYTRELTVYDMLPEGIEYLDTLRIIGADVVVNATINSANNISWVIKNIPAHSVAVIEVLAKVNAVGNLTNNETIVYYDGTNMTVNCTIEVQPIVDVSVDKTSDKPKYYQGDIVVWTIVVSNAANGTDATDVVLSDLLPEAFEFISYNATVGTYADGIWTIGFMGNGTDETLVIVSRGILVGTFTNVANVTCNETDWNESNNVDNATVKVIKHPDIEKDVNNTTPYHFENVEYYLTISNTGDIDYNKNLTVIDSLPDGLVYLETVKIEGATLVKSVVDGQIINWTITNIKANSSAVITVKVFVNATGELTNNGTIVPPYGNNATVNCTIIPIPIADLEVIKLSDNVKVNNNTYSKGNNVTWTIIVINHGPDDAINAVATDFLPSGLIYVSDDSQGAFDYTTGIWNIGNLSSGASVSFNIVTLINTTNTMITNNVNVTSDTYDPNKTNNHDNNTIVVKPEADLEISKLVSKVTSRPNDIITWTIIVKNNGPDTAVNAVVSDKLPSGLVYVSDDSNGAYDYRTGIWKLGNLSKGDTKTLKVKTRVIVTNATITNFANVTSDTPDPNETNNKCNNTTEVPPVADLMLIKDVNVSTAKVGEKVEFIIVVTNLGPDAAINTRAYDLLPSGLKYISHNASVGTYDPATGKWTIGDMQKGDIVYLTIVAEALVAGLHINEAYVESDTYDNDTSNNWDSANVTVEGVEEPPEPPEVPETPKLHATGNPIVIAIISLLAIVGVTIRRKL